MTALSRPSATSSQCPAWKSTPTWRTWRLSGRILSQIGNFGQLTLLVLMSVVSLWVVVRYPGVRGLAGSGRHAGWRICGGIFPVCGFSSPACLRTVTGCGRACRAHRATGKPADRRSRSYIALAAASSRHQSALWTTQAGAARLLISPNGLRLTGCIGSWPRSKTFRRNCLRFIPSTRRCLRP